MRNRNNDAANRSWFLDANPVQVQTEAGGEDHGAGTVPRPEQAGQGEYNLSN